VSNSNELSELLCAARSLWRVRGVLGVCNAGVVTELEQGSSAVVESCGGRELLLGRQVLGAHSGFHLARQSMNGRIVVVVIVALTLPPPRGVGVVSAENNGTARLPERVRLRWEDGRGCGGAVGLID
jgi:hypothetical protein